MHSEVTCLLSTGGREWGLRFLNWHSFTLCFDTGCLLGWTGGPVPTPSLPFIFRAVVIRRQCTEYPPWLVLPGATFSRRCNCIHTTSVGLWRPPVGQTSISILLASSTSTQHRVVAKCALCASFYVPLADFEVWLHRNYIKRLRFDVALFIISGLQAIQGCQVLDHFGQFWNTRLTGDFG